MTNKTIVQNREIGTGKYTFDGDMTRLCVCGHRLGVHSATRIKLSGKMTQDCMIEELGSDCPEEYKGQKCDCELFKPKRIK